MNLFNIREANEKDIPLIRELTFQVWPQTYAPILSKEQIAYMLEMMYSEESLQQQMATGCIFLIVYENKCPAGFASYQHQNNGQYKLHKIYVLPSQQGKGTGRFLLEFILQQLKNQNARSLQLQVNRYNNARKFYERLGFKVIQEADFDIGNGFYMNDYVMEKTF